ncbi:hypothetical protein ABAC460_19850 [Asticcacaulis sp. AC460]|nr:hypothetical protein ABAC460_19850 [Asticcacaulis sp. AC460]
MAAVLQELGIALAVASYQASRVIVISADTAGLTVLPRSFDKPMSLASTDGRLAIATRNELVVLSASDALAAGYPRAPDTYARLWLPRSVRFTGEIDLHDIAFAGDTVVGAATRFSCLARLDDRASFTPLWRPPFVSDLVPDDRCHLNGMALDAAGAPRFATALGATDTAEGWRAGRTGGGVLISVPDGGIVLDGLCMPHSPRLFGGVLHVLNSGAGEVIRVESAGRATVLARLSGYTRGLVAQRDILFVGLSRLRDRHGAGRDPLPVEADTVSCGVVALEATTGHVLGRLDFAGGIDEISDLAVLSGAGRHGILNHSEPGHRAALALPEQGFWAQPGPGGQALPSDNTP